MKAHAITRLWLPVLVLAWMVCALPAGAQNRDDYGRRNWTPAPPRIEFRYAPHWVTVPGTNVLVVREDERPAYDMFSYDSDYYIYNHGYWYRAPSWNGPYAVIDMSSVPVEFQSVPEAEWRTYPTAWMNRSYNNTNNTYTTTYRVTSAPAPPMLYYHHNPHWVRISRTNVFMVRENEQPPFDLFRFQSDYYIYDNGYWYRANRWSGPYIAIDERTVPVEFTYVPRDAWRDYPQNWMNRTYNSSYSRHTRYPHRRYTNTRY